MYVTNGCANQSDRIMSKLIILIRQNYGYSLFLFVGKRAFVGALAATQGGNFMD